MKNVSPEYAASMAQPLRERSYIQITFENIDPEAAGDGVWEANNQVPYSEVETLDYDYNYGRAYSTLEKNRWILDSSQDILPDDFESARPDGYTSNALSSSEGIFDTDQPILRRKFSKPRTLPGLTFIFDTRTKTYPFSIKIEYYLEGEKIKTTESSNINNSVWVVEDPVENTDEIVVFALSGPVRTRFRIEGVIFGFTKIFDNLVVSNCKQSHDVDPLTRRLPKETFSFSILDYENEYNPDNPAGNWTFVNEKSPISVRYGYEVRPGEIEWVDPDKYIMNGKPGHKDNVATFSGTGVIESMTDTYYKDVIGDKTLYDMAVAVLRDANLTPTPTGGDPWVLDESLKNMRTNSVLPITTHMNCLQIIAHAARCRFFTDSENIIHIEPFAIPEGDPVFSVDLSTISEKGQSFSKIDKLKAVEVKKYNYALSNDVTEIFKEEEVTETYRHIEFSGMFFDVNVSVSGGSVIKSDVYGRAIDLTLSEGTKAVTITGKGYKESTTVYRLDVAASGEVDVEENSLITNDEMCKALAEHTATYLQYRNTYDIMYRGNPELETQDLVTLQSKFTESMRGLVLTDELTFSGSLSGKVKVKVLE